MPGTGIRTAEQLAVILSQLWLNSYNETSELKLELDSEVMDILMNDDHKASGGLPTSLCITEINEALRKLSKGEVDVDESSVICLIVEEPEGDYVIVRDLNRPYSEVVTLEQMESAIEEVLTKL